ncbi:hypothetical protein M8C17_01800 [Micromonospora sp. RHAY321]|uniref:hypothetical protein n=1 Tax=Micromonospora sp. RHAY321 TaxID=2944807 RepID=UPI00207D3436|nr:hypothetical protein [Micromonospora sp. RHAY321]MCO1593892.1 hypothetical protein [Micromonospora sp. RHAY321]
MNEYDPETSDQTLSADSVSSATSGPSVAESPGGGGAAPPFPLASSPDMSASVGTAEQAHRSGVRRLLSNKKRGWIAAAALGCAGIAVSVGLAGSPSATATASQATAPSTAASAPSTTAGHGAPGGGFPGGDGSGGGGSNARSGPAEGGSIGKVDSVSTSSFTMSTSGGQKVTVNETSSTTYENGTSSTSSAVTAGEPVLVLGTTSGTTITATQVIVQPTDGGSASSSAAQVVPFQRGAPSEAKQVGQIPGSYSEGSGAVVSGPTADKATKAALAAYPGGVVDRVVQLSSGEYEVHNIGVNWPHHIFVNQDFQVIGAE